MSTIKKCHYCGNSFEDKGGLNESPRVKQSTFGQAYAVCSVKCQREFNEYKAEKKVKSDNPNVLAENSLEKSGNCFPILICIGLIIGGIFLFTIPNGWGGGLISIGFGLFGLLIMRK
jgi:hypothetical protein